MSQARVVAIVLSVIFHAAVLGGLRLPKEEFHAKEAPLVLEFRVARHEPPPLLASTHSSPAGKEESAAASKAAPEETASPAPTPTCSPSPSGTATPRPTSRPTDTPEPPAPFMQPAIVDTPPAPVEEPSPSQPETGEVAWTLQDDGIEEEIEQTQIETGNAEDTTSETEVEGSASPAVTDNGRDEAAVIAYRKLILERLQSKQRYPHRARKQRIEGRVTVVFFVEPTGELREVSIGKGSGHQILDEAALDLIQDLFPMPPPPDGAGEFRVTIEYSMD